MIKFNGKYYYCWERMRFMKYIKYFLLIIISALLGGGCVILFQNINESDKSNKSNECNLSDKIVENFEENLIIRFNEEEEYLIGNYGDTSLYIKFKEDAFNIKEGEEFNYRAAIAASNGDTTLDEAINAVYLEYTEGQYLVRYTVRDEEDSSKSRTYVKLLTVSKD